MCHLVLIHRSLGTEGANPEEEERILEQYTRYLMESDKLGEYQTPIRSHYGYPPSAWVGMPAT